VFAATPAIAEVVDIEDGEIGDIGATTVVNIIMDTVPNGLSGYNMTISLSNASIAEIISVEFPTWASINSNSTLPADTFWMKAADLMNQVQPGDTNINLGTVTIRGDVQGECNITAIVTKMDDDLGDPISPSVDPGVLTVAPVTISFYPQELTVRDNETIEVILDKAPNGLSGYNITVSLENASIAELLSVEFPAWAAPRDNSSLPADSFWMRATDATHQVEDGETNISLGTITIRGDNGGIGNITIQVTFIDNDEGYAMPVLTVPAQIEVVLVIPLPGHVNPPTDPDEDGLYEDLNGNGVLDFDDVTQFFNYMEWIEVNEPISCFDFNGNGRIDFDDVVTLFDEV